MSNNFTITYQMAPRGQTSVVNTRVAVNFSIDWWKQDARTVDLVPFNASDGAFLTNYGYTIIVKI